MIIVFENIKMLIRMVHFNFYGLKKHTLIKIYNKKYRLIRCVFYLKFFNLYI
jgi:hypothetical protein